MITPPGRNDACPCGSGKKFKKCCGAVINIAPASTPLAARQCGTCTACCDGWAAATINGHEMKPGTPCFYRGEGCCTIYDTRPKNPCRNFICGWLQKDSPFPENFRPNEIGVMIVPIKWQNAPAYILCNAGRDPDAEMIRWMEDFATRTKRPFFYELAGERFGFGPTAFQQEMAMKVARGERLW